MHIVHYISITNPTNFSEIYTAVQAILNNYSSETLSSDNIDFNATSGTPTMQMVWLLFSKTLIGRPLTASRSGDVALQDFPFEIHADFVPEKTKNQIKNKLSYKKNFQLIK